MSRIRVTQALRCLGSASSRKDAVASLMFFPTSHWAKSMRFNDASDRLQILPTFGCNFEIPRHSTDPPASAKGGANGDRDHVQWCESRVMVCAAVRHVRLFPDQVRLR